MFWGVTILGGRRYTQTVERSYHISKAVLEIPVESSTKQDQGKRRVQVMLEQNKSHFLLCSLDTDKNIQVDLDLIFTEGEEVTFYLNGQGSVHLTGYVLDFDDVEDYDDYDEDEESEDEEVTNENEKRLLKGGLALNAKKPKVDAKVNGLADDEEEDDEDDDVLGALDVDSDEDDDEEEDEDDEEDDEEELPIVQKPKSAQKQINGQAPKVQQQPQKGTPAKGPQNQKNVASAGKQNNQGGQQNKFGQKGQNSPLGQKPNQNQKGGNQQQQQKGQANQNKQQLNTSNKAKGPFTPDQKGERKSLPGGLQIDEIHEGHGPEARKGKFVHVRYVGRLANNKEFDRSSNKPFSFRLGAGEVIKGWDLGLQGMKVGGKRKIVVPPNMGYGSRSAGPIPPNSQLHFEVELVSVS